MRKLRNRRKQVLISLKRAVLYQRFIPKIITNLGFKIIDVIKKFCIKSDLRGLFSWEILVQVFISLDQLDRGLGWVTLAEAAASEMRLSLPNLALTSVSPQFQAIADGCSCSAYC